MKFIFYILPTISLWAVSLLSLENSSVGNMHIHFILYSVAVYLAVLIYHPHFLATYYLKVVGKECSALKLGLSFSFYYGLISAAILLSSRAKIISEVLLTGIVFFSAYHFSMQTFGLMKLGSFRHKKLLQRSFIVHPFIAVLFMLCQVNRYDFFGVEAIFFPFSENTVYSILIFSALIHTSLLLWLYLRKKIDFLQACMYFCHLIIWTDKFFIVRYGFFIPGLHALQFAPYFIEKIKLSKSSPFKKAKLIFFVLAMSLIFLTLLPNYLDYIAKDFFKENFFLVSMLLSINLHHFLIDTFFKSSRQGRKSPQVVPP